jgi:hypothetical protein
MCDSGGVVQAAGNSSSVTGGAWARRVESGFGPQAEVLEDTLRHIALLDAGDEPHLALTARTLQDIDAKDPLQQCGPIEAIRHATDVDLGDAAGDDGGGDVLDTCGSAGGSAPSMVAGGRGTTLSRRRLVGAKTPHR